MRFVFAIVPIFAFLTACDPPVEGELRADSSLEVPMTDERACMVTAEWRRLLPPHLDSITSVFPTVYPDGLRFVVDGRELAVTGTGGMPSGHSTRWDDGMGSPLQLSPEWTATAGREWAELYACTHGTVHSDSCVIRALKVGYIGCGERTELRGVIEGDRFVLDDGSGVTMAAVGAAGGMVVCMGAGGACMGIVPLLAIAVVVMRKRKRAADG